MTQLKIYSRLLLVVFLLFNYSCKHKEKQVMATKKQVPRKNEVKPKVVIKNSDLEKKGTSELQQKLNLTAKQIHENKLYVFIEDWYGTPYKYGGCQKNGVDCSCFANLLYDKVYNKKIARSALDMYNTSDKINLEDAVTGDLVFFKIGGNTVSHVGVFLKNKLFVHASNSKGVIINSLDEAYYKKYFFCAGKMRNV